MSVQLSLFDVAKAYAGTAGMSNEDLYRKITHGVAGEVRPIGHAGQKHNVLKRKIRWYQQTLTCGDQRAYKKSATAIGMQSHGASYPLRLAKFLVEFLTDKDDLVIDPMAGSMTTAKAAQALERRWIACDVVYDYVRGAAERFRDCKDFAIHV